MSRTPGPGAHRDAAAVAGGRSRRRGAGPVGARRSEGLARLSRVARRQFGIVTTQQAAEAGLDHHALTALQQRGVLQCRFRGVYAFLGAPDRREARWLAAQMAVGGSGALSHATAAAAHGLPLDVPDERVHLTLRHRPRQAPQGVVVHLSPRHLVPAVRLHGVLPVTTVARTLCDIAGGAAGPLALRKAVGAAIRSGRMSPDDLQQELERRRRFAGRAVLRRIVEELSPSEARARSELESLFLRVTTRGGVPPTAMNHRVVDADGRTRELDAVWLPAGVYAELDSRRFHGTLLDWHDDLRRENAVALAGFPLCLRFSWWDLQHHPDLVVDTVRRALDSAV